MKKSKTGALLPALAGAVCLLLTGGAELALWYFTGYAPLLALALLQLLPAGLDLLLLLPLGREPAEAPEKEKTKNPLLTVWRFLDRQTRRLAGLWHKKWSGLVAVLLFAVLLAANCLFWPNVGRTSDPAGLAYWVPVALLALFALSVILEKWLEHTADREDCGKRAAALAKNVRGAMAFGRAGQVLTALTMVLSLIGLYDAQSILQIALLVLFLYETVMLALSAAIRLIRRELATAPLLPLSPKAMGDAGVLTYLEENTGITMRSLWSMRLVRQLIPGVALGVVLLTWLATGVVQIDSHQEGALYRFGKLQDQTLEPGLHLTLPWPFDKVEVYDTQSLRKVVIGYVPDGESTSDNTWTEGHGTEEYRLLLGGGNEMVSINLVVEYRISDLNQYLRSSANADALLSAAAYEIVTERTISTDIDTLLSTDRTVFSETFRQDLEQRISQLQIGIEVTEVVLESIHPPVEVAAIYQRVISAGIQAEQIVLEAEREAIAEIFAAKQQAQAEVSIASTSYYQEVAAAQGAVAEFMASVEAYNAYPGAYTFYKYTTTTSQAYQKGILIIVGEGVDEGALIIGDLQRPVEEDPYYIDEEVEEEYWSE